MLIILRKVPENKSETLSNCPIAKATIKNIAINPKNIPSTRTFAT